MHSSFIMANAIVLFFMMDPFGNLPLFVAILHDQSYREYRKIVLRECLIALGLLFSAAFAGRWFLKIMGLNPGILRLSGGLILLILGIRMVFSTIVPQKEDESVLKEPFIVPLATPLICGPGTIAMVMTFLHSSPEADPFSVSSSLVLAWAAQSIVLVFGKSVARVLGNRMLDAIESLMGLLLTSLAVGMLVTGIKECFFPASL